MKQFRCYCISEAGKANESLVIEAATAAAAGQEALARFQSHPYVKLEVWDGTQCALILANPHAPRTVRKRMFNGHLRLEQI